MTSPQPGELVRVRLTDGTTWTGRLRATDRLAGEVRIECGDRTVIFDGRAVAEVAPVDGQGPAPPEELPARAAAARGEAGWADTDAPLTETLVIAPPGPDTRLRANLPVVAALFLGTLLVYTVSYGGEGRHFDYFVRLADAFLHGRLHLTETPPWLSELIPWEGRHYVVFPPMPAILLLPFVAVFGPDFPQPALSILLGAANVALAYVVLLRLFANRDVALWTSVLYGIGTNQWYHAEVGSAWFLAQIVAMFFVWLALLEGVTRRRMLVIGLCISGAFLSRVTTIGAVAFFLVYFWDRLVRARRQGRQLRFRLFVGPLIQLGLGLAVGVAVAALYNLARFGSVREFGYSLIPGVLEEPWYTHGLVSVRYIPVHLEEMFLRLPRFQADWPFAIPRVYAMAVWVTTPAWLLILFARFQRRLVVAAAAAVLATLPALVMHGGPGFTQFGNRFSLDYMPFLLILAASGMRGRVTWWVMALIGLSVLVNLWGVLMLTRFNSWVF
jgi:hypothetical protein